MAVVATAGDKKESTESVSSILTEITSLGTIARHGVRDAFITLNVDGQLEPGPGRSRRPCRNHQKWSRLY